MIRPRGGNFVYSEDELEIMINDIQICSLLGVDGVTFGCLTREKHLDKSLFSSIRSAPRSIIKGTLVKFSTHTSLIKIYVFSNLRLLLHYNLRQNPKFS